MKKLLTIFSLFTISLLSYTQTFENLIIDPDPQENPDPDDFLVFNNQILFNAYSTEHGTELWTTDGTQEGTFMLKEIAEGAISSKPNYFCIYQDKVIFSTDNFGVWITDGTPEGTIKLTDENLHPWYAPKFGFIVSNNKIFFSGADSNLWESDGTVEGTNIFLEDVFMINAVSYNGFLFFNRYDNAGGTELWKTDGTVEGTQFFISTNENNASNPNRYAILNNKLLFFSFTHDTGIEMFITDGTVEGTIQLTDYITNYIGSISIYQNKIFFFCDTNNDEKVDLWCSDGTVEGTYEFKIFNNSIQTTYYSAVYKDLLYFTASNDEFGREIWVTDGTEEGTEVFIDLTPGSSGSAVKNFNIYNDLLFFITHDEYDNNQLYFTDGIAEHTKILVNPQATNPNPFSHTVFDKMYENNGSLYIKARYTSTDYDQLWKLTLNLSAIDNISNSNKIIVYPNPFSNYLQIDIDEPIKSVEIFDVRGKLIKEINSNAKSIDASDLYSGTYFVRIVTEKELYHTTITKY